MEIRQVAEFVNIATAEILGTETPFNENLTNIIDVGKQLTDIDFKLWIEKFMGNLINHIGKVVVVNRTYNGSAPSVLMDGWEYGSILEKIHSEMPEAVENESWDLTNGVSYDPNIYYKPKAYTKFFNKRTTFEIDRSIVDRQIKQSFSSAEQMNAFVSMLFNEVNKSMTVKTDALIMRTINNFIGATLIDSFPTQNYSDNSTARAVNLLKLYNDKFGQNVEAENAIYTPEFIRFSSHIMGVYMDRMRRMSTNFNIGGTQKFTPEDKLHFVTLSDFNSAADAYLQSDVYHDKFTRLPNSETVAYWQGSGLEYSFNNISEIHNTITDSEGNTKTVEASGIIGCMFDRDALGVTNVDRRVTTNYNSKAEFTNYFYKAEAGYFNDYNENFVVFFVA